ncbi:hypothetical protein HGRIS_005925 [Hohenbuehelia grisea]|uniref:CoA-transferase family III n=1 Tax=Hohenbuehelia grisea TaxID=104357 RepID=A0ABR3JYS4_9AGAR
MSAFEAARDLWLGNKLPKDELRFLQLNSPSDPAVTSSFRLGAAAQIVIGLSALSAAYLHRLRTGIEQNVSVDARHAVLEFLGYYQVQGQLAPSKDSLWDSIAGLYKTQDDSYVRIHTNFPHHRSGILEILGLTGSSTDVTREEVAEALFRWDSKSFEEAAAERGMCATALRSFDEWDRHAQAQALRGVPPVSIKKVGEAPKRSTARTDKPPGQPLDGVKILDLTRVLAGPVCGRTLAMYGADVLWITSPRLPSLPLIDLDTSRGKRTAQLDLTEPADRVSLRTLVDGADVFLQAYRPGGLEEKGFGVEELVKMHPGIVCANLRAWGWDGPWSNRRAV